MRYLVIGCISILLVVSAYFFTTQPQKTTNLSSERGDDFANQNQTFQHAKEESAKEAGIDEKMQSANAEQPEQSEERSIFNRIYSLLGGVSGYGYIAPEEFIAYERWREEIGYFNSHPKDTGYGAYTVETLISLAEQGDLRAYETLISTPDELLQGKLDSDQRLHLGVVAGSNPALYITFSKMYDIANEYYEKGDIDKYKELYVDQFAYLEIYTLRGDSLPSKVIQKIKDAYKLEDVDFVLEQSKERSNQLIEEINLERAELALAPLNFDLPDVAKKVQASILCEGDKKCMDSVYGF